VGVGVGGWGGYGGQAGREMSFVGSRQNVGLQVTNNNPLLVWTMQRRQFSFAKKETRTTLPIVG
jgi:hypothetical protein